MVSCPKAVTIPATKQTPHNKAMVQKRFLLLRNFVLGFGCNGTAGSAFLADLLNKLNPIKIINLKTLSGRIYIQIIRTGI